MNWNNWLYADRLGEEKQTTKSQTNADRIRAMSDEELAIKIYALSNCEMQDCKECLLFKGDCGSAKSVLEWLKQPAKGE